MRQVREGVRLQVLQRQAPEVHALRGPGRQEVPLPPLQQILREERQAEDPHLTRSRETQASQGTGKVRGVRNHPPSSKSLRGAERTAPHSVA